MISSTSTISFPHKIALILAFLLVFSVNAFAQDAPVKPKEIVADGEAYQVAYKVSQEVLSPFCPGKTLAMCTSPNAVAVRRDIQMWAIEGGTPDQIKEKLIDEYGEEYRMVEPPWWDNIGLMVGIGFGFLIALAMILMISKKKPSEDSSSEEPQTPSENIHLTEENDSDDAYRDALRSQYND